MRLYLAAVYTSNIEEGGTLYNRMTDAEKRHRDSIDWYLESYHYIHKQSRVDKIRKQPGRKVFLDSGAFSAFTQGVEVDIDAYCDYCHRNADIIDVASVLDGIGDPLRTWENQRYMERKGVRPLPCFHFGEDERYLEWYVNHYEYITLGGMVPIPTPQLIPWLDRLWERYLTDGSGRPRLKVHGFGLTKMSLIKRYPWYSVDSSSWVQMARTGALMLPRGKVISVSELAPQRKVEGQHLDNLAPVEREALIKELEGYSLDIERARTTYLARWAFNCWSFSEIGRRMGEGTLEFKVQQTELF